MKAAAHPYEDKLLELAYGELTAHEASAVESHVKGCTRCAEAMTEIRAVRSTMAQLPRVEAPTQGLDSLLAYADQAARRNAAGPALAPNWFRRLLTPLVAVGSLAVVGIVGVRIFKDGDAVPAAGQVAVESQKKLSREEYRKSEPNQPRQVVDDPFVAAAPAVPELADDGLVAKEAPAEKQAELKAQNKIATATTEAKPKPSMRQSQSALDSAQRVDELAKNMDRAKDLAPAKSGAAKYKAKKSDADFEGGDQPTAKAEVAAAPAATPAPAAAKTPSVKTADESWGYGVQGGGGKGGEPIVANSQAAADKAPPPPPLAEQSPGGSQNYANRGAPQRTAGNYGNSNGPGSSTGSLSLGGGYGNNNNKVGSLREQAEEDRGPAAADQKVVSSKRDESGRRAVTDLEGLLTQARQASNARNSADEAKLAAMVLSRGATGSQRAEALSRACNALQSLDRVDEAAQYCQQLVREFPDSPVARAYVERQQHASPAPARAKKSMNNNYDEKSPDPERPSSPPADAPAQRRLSY